MTNFFKENKKAIFFVIAFVLFILVGIIVYIYINSRNTLTVDERNWIDENINSSINVNVVYDANVFGSNGEGIYYDFLNDFASEYNLKLNPITFSYLSMPESGVTLGLRNEITDKDVVFYEDDYVLVSKTNEIINTIEEIDGKTIGALKSDVSFIEESLDIEVDLKEYENSEKVLDALKNELNYIIVPRNIYLNDILANDYKILYHFSDLKQYYVLQTDDSLLSSVMKKYFDNIWLEEFNLSYKKNEFNVFVDSLGITESDIDTLTRGVYDYGFINNSPYEVNKAGEFGGISAVILKEFSDFSNVEFKFNKYDSYEDLVDSIDKKEIDIYLDKYNFNSEFKNIFNGINLEYSIIANGVNDIVVKSLNSLRGDTIYVEKNTMLYDFASKIEGVNVLTYSSEKELFNLNKEDVIILIDSNSFEYYSKNGLDNYVERYSAIIDQDITYSVAGNDVLYNLLSSYINVLDEEQLVYKGLYNHLETVKSGNFITLLARYILSLVAVALILLYIVIKKTKKIKIAKKIKKDDKMKFIDQLTSLKNRNYLNECLEAWNNNTIYPQSIIMINLKGIQGINDLHGYNEGDRQIKSFANALIKTQLDNTEIMRTDGNEFIIYSIAYSQKQITNYIHKLNKEVDKLPYQNGAKFGYSMILDDIKTVEDCMNEAANDMKAKNENK